MRRILALWLAIALATGGAHAQTLIGGGGSGNVGGCTSIQKIITAGNQSSVTFSSISGQYFYLQVVWQGRFSDAAATEDLLVQFNGDTGSNYYSQLVSSTSSSAGGAQVVGTSAAHLGLGTAASATANFAGGGEILIPNYSGTTFIKNAVTHDGGWTGTASGNGNVQVWSAVWNNTAAITSIKLTDAGGGNFVNGSTFSLDGCT